MKTYAAHFSPTELLGLLGLLNSFSESYLCLLWKLEQVRASPRRCCRYHQPQTCCWLWPELHPPGRTCLCFWRSEKRSFYQSDQSRGAEEIDRPPCLLSLSPLQDVFRRSSGTLGLRFTRASRARFLPPYLGTGWFLSEEHHDWVLLELWRSW